MPKEMLLGTHMSPEELMNNHHLINDKFGVIQIMAGSPQTFGYNQEIKQFIKRYSADYKIVVHSPFVVNLVNANHKTYQSTIDHTIRMCELAEYGLWGYVTHCGKVFTKEMFDSGNSVSLEYGNDSLIKALEKVVIHYERSGLNLFLENTPGTKINSDIASIGYLISKVREFNSTSLKVAFDTEHAYANGDFKMDDIDGIANLKEHIGLVHFNAIEKGVEFGSHLDRHSFTAMEECTKFKPQNYVDFFNKFKGIPMVFERRELSLALRDYEFLKSRVYGI